MEAFKLARETIIVGLLALPWLAAAIDLLAPTLDLKRIVSFVAGEAKMQAVFGVALLSLAYVLGSAVTPLAQEFVDDEHWYKVNLPTERSTKAKVYVDHATCSAWLDCRYQGSTSPPVHCVLDRTCSVLCRCVPIADGYALMEELFLRAHGI